jgi:hypothetical protein
MSLAKQAPAWRACRPPQRTPYVNAGLTFTMLRGVEPLIPGPTETILIREQLERLSPQATYLNLKSAAKLRQLTASFELRP